MAKVRSNLLPTTRSVRGRGQHFPSTALAWRATTWFVAAQPITGRCDGAPD